MTSNAPQTARTGSTVGASSSLGLTVIRGGRPIEQRWPTAESMNAIVAYGLPSRNASPAVNAWRRSNFRHLARGLRTLIPAKALGIPTMYGALFGRVIRGNGQVEELGLMSLRLVTTTGCGFIVDAFQNLVELEDMKYHGYGTGGAAEASANTALTTELTTEYVVNSTRPTGTTTEASATVYRTVATLAPDSGGTLAITEHGVFSQAATGGGVMIDRTLFSAVNLVASSDSLQTTYDLTFTAGS